MACGKQCHFYIGASFSLRRKDMDRLNFPKEVEIIEVRPRDGLQNEPKYIPVEKKKELIKKLGKLGFKRIETTSFVHPKRCHKWRMQRKSLHIVMN